MSWVLLVMEGFVGFVAGSFAFTRPGHCVPSATAASADSLALVRLRASVATLLDPILRDRGLRRAKVGVHVSRLSDGTDLYAANSDTLLIPASNMKVITTAAALKKLGPDYQFLTEIYGDLHSSGEIRGDLVVRGYGDPYLVPERVWYLASRLYYAGVRQVNGDLRIDDTYFSGSRLATGWEQDKTSNAYMAPAGAVSVGFNALLIHVLPNASVGQAARVLLDPASSYVRILGSVRTVAHGRSSVNVDLQPDGDHDVVRLSGQINVSDSGRGYWRRINNPPMFAGEVLKASLAQLGITVVGTAKVGSAPQGMQKILDYNSSRLAELIGPLNKYSNNFMAMQVAYAMGARAFGPPGDWTKGRQVLEEFLTHDVGLPAGSFVINNASGLHDVNRLSAHQIVQVLAYMRRQPAVWPEFIASLAVAGGSGTLQDRMTATEAAHILRAKTGTLSSASALSGYVTVKSGEILAFSFLVNGYQEIEEIWSVQDRLGAALASLTIAPPPVEPNSTASTLQGTAEDSKP